MHRFEYMSTGYDCKKDRTWQGTDSMHGQASGVRLTYCALPRSIGQRFIALLQRKYSIQPMKIIQHIASIYTY
jgi:hypothetical protein